MFAAETEADNLNSLRDTEIPNEVSATILKKDNGELLQES